MIAEEDYLTSYGHREHFAGVSNLCGLEIKESFVHP